MSAISYKTFLDNFTTTATLGIGGNGVIQQVRNKLTRRTYAHKYYRNVSPKQVGKFLNEISIMEALDCDEIPKIFHYYFNQDSDGYHCGFVMDELEQSLDVYLNNNRNVLSPTEAGAFILQMVTFFSKMKEKGYIHRDIKPQNIMLSKQKKYKIIDFGSSIKMNCFNSKTIAGTKEYLSPKLKDILQTKMTFTAGNNYKDDSYALGKTILEVLLRTRVNSIELKSQAFDRGSLKRKVAETYGPSILKIIEIMIKEEQACRLDFSQILNLINRGQIQLQKVQFQCATSESNFQMAPLEIQQPFFANVGDILEIIDFMYINFIRGEANHLSEFFADIDTKSQFNFGHFSKHLLLDADTKVIKKLSPFFYYICNKDNVKQEIHISSIEQQISFKFRVNQPYIQDIHRSKYMKIFSFMLRLRYCKILIGFTSKKLQDKKSKIKGLLIASLLHKVYSISQIIQNFVVSILDNFTFHHLTNKFNLKQILANKPKSEEFEGAHMLMLDNIIHNSFIDNSSRHKSKRLRYWLGLVPEFAGLVNTLISENQPSYMYEEIERKIEMIHFYVHCQHECLKNFLLEIEEDIPK